MVSSPHGLFGRGLLDLKSDPSFGSFPSLVQGPRPCMELAKSMLIPHLSMW